MIKKLLFLFVAFYCNVTFGQLVINEVDSDNTSTDTFEFVEIKSATANFSLNGYALVFYNGANNLSYYALDLDGYSTDINGNILIGNTGVTPSPAINFANSLLQNGPDAVAIYSGNASDFPNNTTATPTGLIHAIAYGTTATQPTALMTALGITEFVNENINSLKDTQSIQRKNDGTYEVKLPTPGANNDGSGIPINYVTVGFTQASYNEGDSFNITFTTSQPVQNETLIMNFTLNNGNFTMSDFSGGLTVSIPVGQTTTQTGIILTNDVVDEGDEEMLFQFQPLPTGYVANNDNIVIRVYDNDYQVQPWGTPLNPTYGIVSSTAPLGYYSSLEGLSGATLKQAVQDIIANPSVVRLHSYADIWEILRTADQNPENSNQVWCMYIEQPMAKLDQQNGSSIVGKWNREHIFPQSRGGFEVAMGDSADGIGVWNSTSASSTVDGVSDAHHIRAENGQENSSRNNKNYGPVNSGTVYAGQTGTQGSWRGDVARALFYMAVRFNGLNVVNGDPSEYLVDGTTPSGNIGDLATLLTWNTTDPKDDFEMNRNNYIYTWQMNRNPFIDYPNLADYIWGANAGQPWSATLSSGEFAELKLALYPNPSSGNITIAGAQNDAVAEFYNMTGQKVKAVEFVGNTTINLDLQSGLYMVKITSGNQSTTRKLIVK
ncbi:endonuclease [Flavobacterium sp.]|uniref:endonuclease n=1 Tax=Flavobacterium sp. TaxID=239 RepID=UPI0028BD3C87|nr:endonuclease [Flavobacterium sp.]